LALLALLTLSACQHVEPMLVTRDALVLTDKTFIATQAIINSFKSQLSPAVWASWVQFEMRFATSFHAARMLYDDAEAAAEIAARNDGGTDAVSQANLAAAAQVVVSLVSQLAYWQGVVVQLSHPDGGAP
jgi:hypothetical protein